LMPRNLERCSHCGKKFIAITARIASVNRSDGKSFHLMLYSGPDYRKIRRIGSGSVCIFTYRHDRVGPREESVSIAFMGECASEEMAQQIEQAADMLEDMVRRGRQLERGYTFDLGQLKAGFPK
jgi:hypothetical protein